MSPLGWLKECDRSCRHGTWRFLAVSLAIVLLANGPSAHAGLIINPTFDTTITSDPNAGVIQGAINAAIAVYQTKFTDPITVNIKFQEGGGLGSSSTAFANVSYATYLAALIADAKTANDALALAHLPGGPNNPVNGDATINVKTANLRAVGIAVNPPFDGTITLNTALTSPGSPVTTGQFDLMVVAEHEIDEVLGLGSSLPNIPLGTIFPEDLYRYNQAGVRSFTTNSGVTAFFSLDGTTRLAQFDNQNDGGDFGDWQSNPLPGSTLPKVQDAFATAGSHPTLGVELTALDVIGYDLSNQAAVPEPATLTLLGLGALVLTGHGWRRRRQLTGSTAA